jgi:hypothetical protein
MTYCAFYPYIPLQIQRRKLTYYNEIYYIGKIVLMQLVSSVTKEEANILCVWSMIMCNTDISAYATDLVCYTNSHWFFKHECQHIFGKQMGYIVQSLKTIKTWTTKIEIFTLHWINSIIRNNKCILTKLNAVFLHKTAVWTTKNSTTENSSQIPDRFSKLLCSTAVP